MDGKLENYKKKKKKEFSKKIQINNLQILFTKKGTC